MPCSMLLVEDSDDVRETTRRLLEENGNVVNCVANGREALDWLSVNEPPCLILMDLNMPVMSGSELAEALAANPAWADIPVVLMTASASSMGVRARAFLSKPFGIDQLLRITEYCEHHACPAC